VSAGSSRGCLRSKTSDFDRLEVSSPGLDRPLRKAADFVRFVGEEADFRLMNPVENARRMKGHSARP